MQSFLDIRPKRGSYANCCYIGQARMGRVVDAAQPPKNWNGIVIIGEAPGNDEERWLTAFIGDAGEFLRENVMMPIGINPKETWFKNAVMCRPFHDDEPITAPRTEAIAACRNYLIESLEEYWQGVKCVVVLGRAAVYATIRQKVQITKVRGKLYFFTFEDNKIKYSDSSKFARDCRPLLLCYHPSYAVRKGRKDAEILEMQEVFVQARDIANGSVNFL